LGEKIMAKNFVQEGIVLDATAPTGGVVSGNAYLIQYGFGVALADAAVGENFPFKVSGVFTLPKAASACTKFARAYWDDTSKVITPTASTHRQIGIFAEGASDSDGTVAVRLGILIS
jgi:predicted RecA/RadA family phage recombinase